jgi:hypothetical protein
MLVKISRSCISARTNGILDLIKLGFDICDSFLELTGSASGPQ